MPFICKMAAGGGGGPVAFAADDGDDSKLDVSGSSTHNYGANTATGPYVIVGLTWHRSGEGDRPDLTSLTWNGVAGTILVQLRDTETSGTDVSLGAALVMFVGSQSGDLVAVFDEHTHDSALSKMSLAGLRSTAAVGSDSDGRDGGFDLSYTSAGDDGITVYLVVENSTTSPNKPSGYTEIARLDIDATYSYSMGYKLGASTSISTSLAGTSPGAMVAVTLR
jgi:hypothetical protein